MYIHWKAWCWSWSSNTLATWCKELSHWKRFWFQERLRAGGQGSNSGWDGWMASLTQWTSVWANSREYEGQGSLACCSPWAHKELDATEYQTTKNNGHSRVWVKWALGSINTNASEGDRIPAELFKILKDDTVKVLHSICQQIWKNSFQSQRILKLPYSCAHFTS